MMSRDSRVFTGIDVRHPDAGSMFFNLFFYISILGRDSARIYSIFNTILSCISRFYGRSSAILFRIEALHLNYDNFISIIFCPQCSAVVCCDIGVLLNLKGRLAVHIPPHAVPPKTFHFRAVQHVGAS
jgi:hypothetical protein